MYTPGPWFAEGEYIHVGVKKERYALDRKPTLHLATIHVTADKNSGGAREVLDANARLIASAPDLKAQNERYEVALEKRLNEIRRLETVNTKLLEALEAGNELWGWLPFDSGEDIQQAAKKVRIIQQAALAEAKGE